MWKHGAHSGWRAFDGQQEQSGENDLRRASEGTASLGRSLFRSLFRRETMSETMTSHLRFQGRRAKSAASAVCGDLIVPSIVSP